MVKIRRKRSVPMDEQTRELLDAQRDAFRVKFGREPGPNDPVFFDPDADEPRPIEAEAVTTAVIRAMEEAGIHPRLIYAYRRTGLLVSDENMARLAPRELAEWRAALEEYDALKARSN
jgi:integrase